MGWLANASSPLPAMPRQLARTMEAMDAETAIRTHELLQLRLRAGLAQTVIAGQWMAAERAVAQCPAAAASLANLASIVDSLAINIVARARTYR